jgi:membrane protein insertase Oxa1/YidC/SpoIIIJ
MFAALWYVGFYQPLFNALVWIYTHIAGQNLGWAVVWLTVFMRLVLLPLTLISEKNAEKNKFAEEDALHTVEVYKNDPVVQKEEFRKIMKKHHISPWAKVLSLVLQAVIFVLLYQVFIHGISGEKIMKTLYVSVDYPGTLNTTFYGFQIGKTHNVLWAGVTALYLFGSIIIRHIIQKRWAKSEVYFIVFFPLFTFIILWFLPMVKSLFILTTMVFSDSIALIHYLLLAKKEVKPVPEAKH